MLGAWLVGLLEEVHVLLLAGPPVGGCKRLLAGLLLTDPAHVGGHLAHELLDRGHLGFDRTHSLFVVGRGVIDRFPRVRQLPAVLLDVSIGVAVVTLRSPAFFSFCSSPWGGFRITSAHVGF